MTRELLREFYENMKSSEAEALRLSSQNNNFEADLAYRIASGEYNESVKAYLKAFDEYKKQTEIQTPIEQRYTSEVTE